MIFQLNLVAIAAIATQAAWKKTKPVILRDVFILPVLGFLGIIVLWWIIALANHELMPTPPEALIANLDYMLNPFYQRGPGNLGIGWLLIASLRRVLLGFLLGAVVAIPVGFWATSVVRVSRKIWRWRFRSLWARFPRLL